MSADLDWQCSNCGTLIDGRGTRRCPNCGGINFYPLADEVPSDETGSETIQLDLKTALERLDRNRDT